MTETYKRRFWRAVDVAQWIAANAKPEDWADGPHKAARWWGCYRDTQALVDDTMRHIAQAMMDGIPPYSNKMLTKRLQNWFNADGMEGPFPDIDDEIEADLREFFNVEAKD